VVSRRTFAVVVRDPSPFDQVHETGVPLVSLEIVVEPQPLVFTPAGGALQVTVTSSVCQALQSEGPGEQVGSGGAGGGAVAAAWASAQIAIVATSTRSGSRRAFTVSSSRRPGSADAACRRS
jgi:hypothetical protein